VQSAEQRLFDNLLTECKRLTFAMDYDESGGFYFWPHVEGLVRDGFDCRCGICTSGAKLIAKEFGGFVAGYLIQQEDPQTLVGAVTGGHDFAVVGPFIVDWWAWEYEHSLEGPVILRSKGIRFGKYKRETAWQVHPGNDFTFRK
jgi:hypothetical protein